MVVPAVVAVVGPWAAAAAVGAPRRVAAAAAGAVVRAVRRVTFGPWP